MTTEITYADRNLGDNDELELESVLSELLAIRNEMLAEVGQPSRAEITDAAMDHRAECVMLNKGPHIVSAVRVLNDILRRMQSHQSKKQAMLRELQLAPST